MLSWKTDGWYCYYLQEVLQRHESKRIGEKVKL